jgi:phosphate transport system substrate-binding protein
LSRSGELLKVRVVADVILTGSLIMSKSPNLSSIGYVLITVGLLAGGWFWFFVMNPSKGDMADRSPNPEAAPTVGENIQDIPTPTAAIQVRIDGSTSMVTINKNLKSGFEGKFPGSRVITQSRGSGQGLKALQAGEIDLAAVSRSLTPQEKAQGLESATVSVDPIAIVVGINSLAPNNLTAAQVTGIFNGSIADWASVGGKAGKIRIINRPAISGTHQVFQDLVLKGTGFGTTPNFITLPRDATTPLLQALATDGIGYATYSQVAAQTSVRVPSVGGISPSESGYPYPRSLLYVYKTPPSPTVKAFLGYVVSPEGKQAIKSD